jgi:hypothetical protein
MNELTEGIDPTSVDVVDEYKRYVQHSVMSRGFDFQTWYQHQYGGKPAGLDVESKVEFYVTDVDSPHK